MNGLVTELLTSWVINRNCEQKGGMEAVDNGIQKLRESDIVLHYPILTWVLFPFCRPAKLFRSLLIPTLLNQKTYTHKKQWNVSTKSAKSEIKLPAFDRIIMKD